MTASQATVNDRREIFGWAMYDWANSAFSTTIGSVFLGPYVSGLAKTVAEADFLARTGTAWTEASGQSLIVNFLGLPVAPEAIVPFAISLSVVFQAGFLPILGAIADYSHRRKQMLQLFATIGAIATIAMFFITLNTWLLGPLLFVIANLSFGAALVFYNAIFQILPAKKSVIGSLPMVSQWDISAGLFYLHLTWYCICFMKTLGSQKACRSASTWHPLEFGGWHSQQSPGKGCAHATPHMRSRRVKICSALRLNNCPRPWKYRQNQSRSTCFLLC